MERKIKMFLTNYLKDKIRIFEEEMNSGKHTYEELKSKLERLDLESRLVVIKIRSNLIINLKKEL
jgi:hypothetical protein